MADEKKDDVPLGLGELFRIGQLLVDNARIDGSDYVRVLRDTIDRFDLAMREARGEFGVDRERVKFSRSKQVEFDVPDGKGKNARLMVDGEDILRRLPVKRMRLDIVRERATIRLDVAPMSTMYRGRAEVVVESELRDAAEALMLDWAELPDAPDGSVVEVPIELMRKLREELDR